MSKLSDFFSMSKQERRGAWLIIAFIVVIIAAIAIERRCSSDSVDNNIQQEIKEHVDKASKIKVKEKKNGTANKKNSSAKNKNKSKSTQSSKRSTKKSSSTSSGKKSTSKKKNNSSKKKSTKSKNSTPARALDPVPQF